MFFEVLVSLLGKQGVEIHDVNITETGEVKIDIDFTEHDKVFEDKIDVLENSYQRHRGEICKLEIKNQSLKNQIKELENIINNKLGCWDKHGISYQEILDMKDENESLKKRIAELESKKTEKPTKINLNDIIKVKLTPLGAEIYYHQYDELNKKINANGGEQLEPRMPQIDKDGYTKMRLHEFINLYGEHIGMCKPNVIEPIDIISCE